MKTLSVKQPWATLLTYGISDTENRSWAPKYEGKILIHASSSKVAKNFMEKVIFEQGNHIGNEQMFGNIPDFEDMEYSAILGYVTVAGDVDDSMSVWAFPVEHQWQIKDAYLFDEPIRGVKGKLNLFDTPEISEDNLPKAHKVVRRAPKLEGDCLVIPLTEEWLDEISANKEVYLGATDEIIGLVELPQDQQTDNRIFRSIKTVRFETPSSAKTFKVSQYGYMNWDVAEGQPLKVVNWDMEEMDYFNFAMMLEDL